MAEPLRHRQTKEAATDMFSLQPPRHISTLPDSALRPSPPHGRFPLDCVAKLFSAPRRVRSIQDRAPNRNIDSRARVAGFEYFKFQFHRLPLATFATKSPPERTWPDHLVMSQKCHCTKPLRGREHAAAARIGKRGRGRGSGINDPLLLRVAPFDP